MSASDALKLEIAKKVWEYRKQIDPNSRKLYALDRAQRSAFMATVCLLLLGVYLAVGNQGVSIDAPCVAIIATVVLGVLLCFLDPIVERLGIWKMRRD